MPEPEDTSPPPPPPSSGGPGGDPPEPEARVRPKAWRRSDIFELVGSMLSAVAVTWLLFFRLTPLYGSLGFVVCAFVIFVPLYAVTQRELHGKLMARDRVATVVLATGGVATVVPLVMIIVYTIGKGLEAFHWGFFTETLADTGPLSPPKEGGALHAIIGTLQQVGIAIVLSAPLGVCTAVYLNEVKGRLAGSVRFIIDAMSGLPSIVAGLFIYAVFVLAFGFSGFFGGIALAVLMLPTITRASEEMLRLVPDGLREASHALGAPEHKTVTKVVLPTARPGLVTAVILGTARAVGETAPVLLVTFGSKTLNVNPFSEPQDNLPLFVYALIRSSIDADVARAWTGAMVLIFLVLFLFTIARLLGGSTAGRSRRVARYASLGPLGNLPGRNRAAIDPLDESYDGGTP